MDFFEFLFGKKEDKNVSSQSSSSVNNCKSESTIKSVLQSEKYQSAEHALLPTSIPPFPTRQNFSFFFKDLHAVHYRNERR